MADRLRPHPYTTSFPLIVDGAMMMEPTESESKDEPDPFANATHAIAEEAKPVPNIVNTAPHNTRVARLDEVTAARKPILQRRPIRPQPLQIRLATPRPVLVIQTRPCYANQRICPI